MYSDDILLWLDGFWCFREEHRPEHLRGYDYRIVKAQSNEWRKRIRQVGDPPRKGFFS